PGDDAGDRANHPAVGRGRPGADEGPEEQPHQDHDVLLFEEGGEQRWLPVDRAAMDQTAVVPFWGERDAEDAKEAAFPVQDLAVDADVQSAGQQNGPDRRLTGYELTARSSTRSRTSERGGDERLNRPLSRFPDTDRTGLDSPLSRFPDTDRAGC